MEENAVLIQEEDNVGPIQRYYHEQEVSRLERHNKRLFWALVMTIVFLVASNVGWIYYESQFEDVVYTVESQTDAGGTAIANATGEVTFNGAGESNSQAANP